MTDDIRTEIETNSLKNADETMKESANSAENAGLEVRVSRTYDGVGLSGGRECEWCKERECTSVTLEEAYEIGAFQRHPGCGCEIEYTSKKGKLTVQTRSGGRDSWVEKFNIERRKEYSTPKKQVTPGERIINSAIQLQQKSKEDVLVSAIIENHEALGNMSPVEIKTALEMAGYDIRPLGKKSKHYSGLLFEDGGGFRVSFAGDGHLRYHPEAGRHKIAYWTVSKGKGGKHQYGMDGKELFF